MIAKPRIMRSQSQGGVAGWWGACRFALVVPDDNRCSQQIGHEREGQRRDRYRRDGDFGSDYPRTRGFSRQIYGGFDFRKEYQPNARPMAEAPDSKSGPRKRVWVQVSTSVLTTCGESPLGTAA